MKKQTKTVVVSVLVGGLGSLTGCGLYDAFFAPQEVPPGNPPPPPEVEADDDDENSPTPSGEDSTNAPSPPPERPYGNPPAPPPKVIDEGVLPETELPGGEHHEASYNEIDWKTMRTVNASHPVHGTIYRSRGSCFVNVPFPKGEEPQGSWLPSPTESVDCSYEMAQFLWSQCYGGTIATNPDGSICVCDRNGNPPPPPTYVHCPAEAKVAPPG